VETKKELLFANTKDLVSKLMYYDRKNDEELSYRDVDYLMDNGIVTTEEIIKAFADELTRSYLRKT